MLAQQCHDILRGWIFRDASRFHDRASKIEERWEARVHAARSRMKNVSECRGYIYRVIVPSVFIRRWFFRYCSIKFSPSTKTFAVRRNDRNFARHDWKLELGWLSDDRRQNNLWRLHARPVSVPVFPELLVSDPFTAFRSTECIRFFSWNAESVGIAPASPTADYNF